MKIHTRSLIIAATAFLLPIAALNAADGCCPKDDEKTHAGCAMNHAAAPVPSAFGAPPATPRMDAMTVDDTEFLAAYEAVRAALAADDFEAAKKAATDLEGAEGIVKAKSIAEARVAFKGLSAKAIAMAKGRSGFFVAHCPMVKGGGADWVQTSKKISNPYFGSQMLTCGSIVN